MQNVIDENSRKSVNIALFARPDRFRGFQAGLSVYSDKLTPANMPPLMETILVGHAVYRSSTFEWLNEGMLLKHAQSGRNMRTPGFYTQVSRGVRGLRPYFRYQYVNAPAGDPVVGDIGLFHGPSVGLRYDFSEFAAFKVQYDRTERGRRSGFNSLITQLSVTF